MSKIQMTYNGTAYTLEYTRRTVKTMEDNGFNAGMIAEKPMTMLPMMFRGAFLANHRHLRTDVIDEIFDHVCNKEALMSKLSEMYAEPFNALMDEPEEGGEGNAEWTEI